jgi:two-component system invasion response regulator UvrY
LAMKHLTHEDMPFDKLSGREMQVAMMITSGLKAQEIAESLHMSPKTVNSYRYRIFKKLDISSDVDLTHLAIRHGLVEQ